jgi:hypothetical protein
MKANKVLAGTPCAWCTQSIELGDDAATCTSCALHHHARCWDAKRGCSRKGCPNAPLRELKAPARPPPPPPPPPPPAMVVAAGSGTMAEGAVVSLVFGILSAMQICGPIFGWLAYSKGKAAREACEADPSLGGKGLATAGMVLGVIGIVVFVIAMLSAVSNS